MDLIATGNTAHLVFGTELPLLLSGPEIAGRPMLDTTALHVEAIVRRLREHDAPRIEPRSS